MLPKRRQTSTALTPSAKRTRSTRTTTSDSTSAHATPPDTTNFQELSLSDLDSLPAKMLCSQLKSYKLPPAGTQ